MSQAENARNLWKTTGESDAKLFSLDEFDPSNDVVAAARTEEAVASKTTEQRSSLSTIENGSASASAHVPRVPQSSLGGSLSARHRLLLEERVQHLKQKERSLGRRKVRREENARLSSNPHVSKPTAADFRISSSNPVSSTFIAPVPEDVRVPGEGYLLKQILPDKAASTSASMGKYSFSLRDARRILEERGSLSYKHLPPTRESWQADPMQQVEGQTKSLDVIQEETEAASAVDHGPLQRVLLKAAVEISEWIDSLTVPVPNLEESISDLRDVALKQMQAGKAEDEPNEEDHEEEQGDTTITAGTYDAEPEADPDGFWIEVERTPRYMCWIVEDAFDRLMLHCLARIYGCSSFSCDERWKARGRRSISGAVGAEGSPRANGTATAPPEREGEEEEIIRCTYIFNPRRGNKRWKRASKKKERRRRNGSLSAASGRDSSVDTALDTEIDTIETGSSIDSVDDHYFSEVDAAGSEGMSELAM